MFLALLEDDFIRFIAPNHYESYKVLNHSIKASNQNASYRLYVYIATIYDTRYYIIFMNITNIETIKDAHVFIQLRLVIGYQILFIVLTGIDAFLLIFNSTIEL